MNTNIQNDDYIRKIDEILKQNSESQIMFVYRGRSIPATYGESYESKDENGNEYLSIMCWDGDSGNTFDINYKLLPDKVYINGKEIIVK